MKFKELSTYWMENVVFPERKKNTYCAYNSLLKSHIYPAIGDLNLTHVSLEKVICLRNSLISKDLSFKTINEICVLIKNVLNFGVKVGKTSQNLIVGLNNLPIEQKTINIWSKKHCELFLSNVGPKYKELYIIALNTGLRLGELLALTPFDLDFEAGLIRVSKTRTAFGIGLPKSNKPRFVPMNDRVKNSFMQTIETLKTSDLIWDYSPAHFTVQIFKPAQEAISGLPIITFHDLRHTFASHFMMNGGNIFDLSKILGHSDPKLTSTVYAHLSPKHLSTLTHHVSL